MRTNKATQRYKKGPNNTHSIEPLPLPPCSRPRTLYTTYHVRPSVFGTESTAEKREGAQLLDLLGDARSHPYRRRWDEVATQ